MKGLKVLSLFDGMSCGMIAFIGAGISVERYVAYEIDKYAIETSKHNFPQIEHKGDVFDADFTQYKDFDYLIGGSPCTYWSIAQSPDKRETTASGMGWELFSQYIRALKEAKPKYFIYENNKSMSNAIKQSITNTFGFEPILINSALVSAQNRERLYWVGIRQDDGTYAKANVEMPCDKGIMVKDILDCVFQNEGIAEPICVADNGKSHTLKAQYYKNGTANFITNGGFKATAVAKPVKVGSLPRPNGELSTSQAFRIYDENYKSVTLKAQGCGSGAKTGLYATTDVPIYEVKNGTITIKGKQYPINLKDGFYNIRKLTVSECKRLQTVPEWYKFKVSNTQAYKMLGNGWTVDVIAHIFKGLMFQKEINEIKKC